MRYKLMILFCLPLLCLGPCLALTNTAAAPFIWWSPGEQVRLADGRTEQVLTLQTSSVITMERAEAWLRITVPRLSQVGWYKGHWSSSEPYSLVVQSGEYVMADVFARAEIQGLPYFAQTRLRLYGQSKDAETDRENASEDPGWPEFNLRSGGDYWPQTGDEFHLSLSGGKTSGDLEVRDSRGALVGKIQLADDGYKYTPPHDSVLNRIGPLAVKPLIFVARIDGGGSACFTQLVHRSRYGLWNKKAGVTVFTAAFFASGLVAWLIRRKARPCR
jgi:hypothetical protein